MNWSDTHTYSLHSCFLRLTPVFKLLSCKSVRPRYIQTESIKHEQCCWSFTSPFTQISSPVMGLAEDLWGAFLSFLSAGSVSVFLCHRTNWRTEVNPAQMKQTLLSHLTLSLSANTHPWQTQRNDCLHSQLYRAPVWPQGKTCSLL